MNEVTRVGVLLVSIAVIGVILVLGSGLIINAWDKWKEEKRKRKEAIEDGGK